jgi:hypothetical protein
MLAVVFSLRKNRHYLQETEHKITIISDHQNLAYFKSEFCFIEGKPGGQKNLSNTISHCLIAHVPPMARQIYFLGARRSPLEKGVQLQQQTR